MKKILILTALLLSVSLCAFAQPLYTSVNEQVVSGGITLKNEKRFFGDYALEINLITADLKNENLSLELLKHSGGADKTATVSQLAGGEEKTVVAINGDFFSAYKNNQNFSLGLEVKDGKLLQSHINSDMAAGFFGKGALSLSYVDFKAELALPNGEAVKIAHINKPTDYYGALLMYTPDFNGGESPFLPEGITAVTVTDGKVTGKGISLGGTLPIPENGYILVIDDNMSPTLDHNINREDILKVTVSATPSLENVETAFGGGSLLLKDGQKTPITHNVSGNHPRSVIGTNEDGSIIYIMTVDGRKTSSRGVSLENLSDICLEMGMVNAINLDGGGSTALVGKTLFENELHTINSPTENRKVINAIAITSDAEKSEAIGVFGEAEKGIVLSGDSVKLKTTAYDKNYNSPKSVSGKIKWSVPKGRGYVRDNIYYPEKEGEVTLELYYNGKKTDSVSLYVMGDVSGIIAPKEYTLEFGKPLSLGGEATVFDKHGNITTVENISLLNPIYDRKFITISDGNVQAMKEGAGTLTLSHSGADRKIKLICGKFDADTDESIWKDDFYKESEGGFTFDILSPAKETSLYDRIVYANAMDALEKEDASAIIGGDKIEELTPEKPIIAGEYKEVSIPNGIIISLETSGGKISRGKQWEKISSALKSENKNIFILLDEKENFVTELDREAFYSMLTDASESKNIFVIYGGDENFCTIKNGARFISVKNARSEKVLHKSIEKATYLSFNITGNEVSYQFRKIFE